jgi:hypothetical protein
MAVFVEFLFDVTELDSVWKGFEQEKINHFLECDLFRKILGQISAIYQFSVVSVHITDFCTGDGDASEAGVDDGVFGQVSS